MLGGNRFYLFESELGLFARFITINRKLFLLPLMIVVIVIDTLRVPKHKHT
jgi:hypothetical protein